MVVNIKLKFKRKDMWKQLTKNVLAPKEFWIGAIYFSHHFKNSIKKIKQFHWSVATLEQV